MLLIYDDFPVFPPIFLVELVMFSVTIQRSAKELNNPKIVTNDSTLSIDYLKARETDRNYSLSAVSAFLLDLDDRPW